MTPRERGVLARVIGNVVLMFAEELPDRYTLRVTRLDNPSRTSFRTEVHVGRERFAYCEEVADVDVFSSGDDYTAGAAFLIDRLIRNIVTYDLAPTPTDFDAATRHS